MATTIRRREQAAAEVARARAAIGAELRATRIARNVSLRHVAGAAGLSASEVSRIERALVHDVSLDVLIRVAAVLGLRLSVRAYPTGVPVRDAAQLGLLERLRSRLAPSVGWSTEVAMPIVGDIRAWDALLTIPGAARQRVGVDGETRLGDVQETLRRVALKERDGAVDRVILLCSDTHHNRRLLGEYMHIVTAAFPVTTRAALAALGAGRPLSGNALIVL